MTTYYQSTDQTLESLEKALRAYTPNPQFPHDVFVYAAVEEALFAAQEGNFGVGACLVKDGQIVQRGRNHVIHPYFRSDLHAEMDVMTRFEEANKNTPNMREYALFTSLEPCPMCVVRLAGSGVGHIYHAMVDVDGGMATRLQDLPPAWNKLASRLHFGEADCSPQLKEISLGIWLESANKRQTVIGQR